jgi:hypothetical protein
VVVGVEWCRDVETATVLVRKCEFLCVGRTFRLGLGARVALGGSVQSEKGTDNRVVKFLVDGQTCPGEHQHYDYIRASVYRFVGAL